jgi:nucleoside-diphosphate-sugar epimerase
MLRNKKILITGGAGFIGSHLALRLADANDVCLLDIQFERNAIRYTSLATHPRVRLVHCNVCDPAAVQREMAGCNYVVHLASLLGVKNVIDNARPTMDTIVLGTRNVLEAAAAQNGNLERLINVSTSEIYGNTTTLGELAPASISAGNDPRMCYSAAKLLGEHMAWAYFRDAGVRVVNVRPFNVYGPWRRTSNAVGVFIVRALAGSDLVMHGDGSQLRSWCYIEDFCDGLLACMEREGAVGQDFNIGNALTTSTIFDLAERVIRMTGSKSKVCLIDRPFSDINVRAPGPEKAARVLNYRPRYGMDEGLRLTIDWHRQHLADFQHWL